MSIGLRLDLRQSQQLVMTPQLQQAIKLLQMSNLELAGFVESEVEKNPLLEMASPDTPQRGEDVAPAPRDDTVVSTDRVVTQDGDPSLSAEVFDTGSENLHDSSPSDGPSPVPDSIGPARAVIGRGANPADLPGLEERLAERPSLSDHLRAQLGQARAPLPIVQIARVLVDELDEVGYLRTEGAALAERLGASPGQIAAAIDLLQGCEPCGVGARSLAECLALQLAERNRLDPAMQALLDNLDLITLGKRTKLRKLCGVDDDDFDDMLTELRTLNPRPCDGFDRDEPQTVVPDILLHRTSWGGWQIELNAETLPRVLLDRTYTSTVNKTSCDETRSYLTECHNNASWLIKSMDQRAKTIMKVATEIIRHQDQFFTEGISGLKPLTLRAVADAIGMHESTASRVTSNKYIATERGIFELKFFFTNAVGGGDGDIAAESVRHRIKALVDAEDFRAILSDDSIVESLKSEGIDIARRTVAKYRKSLNIPSSVDRRRMKAMSLER